MIAARLLLGTLVVAGCRPAPTSTTNDTTKRNEPQQAVEDASIAIEWNKIYVDTLRETKTPNPPSARIAAIVHTAMFDAYNGIKHRFTPLFYAKRASTNASAHAAVIAAAHTTLVALFPSRKTELDASYSASLGKVPTEQRQAGIEYGIEVANAVLAWRASDGFNIPVGVFKNAEPSDRVGQWRPTPPDFAPMSYQQLASTKPWVLTDYKKFFAPKPRGLTTQTYLDDYNAIKSLGSKTSTARTADQTELALIWDGNASAHWNEIANQIIAANPPNLADTLRAFALLNIGLAESIQMTWTGKRDFGADPTAITWRPITAIHLGDRDGVDGTAGDPAWAPLIKTPTHPEYPASHCSQNAAGASALLTIFADAQTFTVHQDGLPPRAYRSIGQARQDGNNARIWGGMHYPSTVVVTDAGTEALIRHIDATVMQRVP